MRFWSMQGGWVEPLAKRNNLQLELFKQVNGSPLYLANQLSILSLGYLTNSGFNNEYSVPQALAFNLHSFSFCFLTIILDQYCFIGAITFFNQTKVNKDFECLNITILQKPVSLKLESCFNGQAAWYPVFKCYLHDL